MTAPNETDSRAIWSACAADETVRGERRDPIRYVPTGFVGRLLLACCRDRIFSYAEADRPKLAWLRKALQDTGPLVLDIGVRTGDLARQFRAWGKRVHGIDIAEKYIEHCKSAGIIEHGAACNVESEELPAPSDFEPGLPAGYDVIFLGEIIEHLLGANEVLKKVARVCRPGGTIIITTPNLAYLGNRIRLLLGRDLHPLTIDRGEVGHQHIRVYTARLLRGLLADAGCRVVDVGSDGVLLRVNRFVRPESDASPAASPDLPPAQLALPLTIWPFPTWGRTIFIKAVRQK